MKKCVGKNMRGNYEILLKDRRYKWMERHNFFSVGRFNILRCEFSPTIFKFNEILSGVLTRFLFNG